MMRVKGVFEMVCFINHLFKKLSILSSSHYETKSFNVQPYGECVEYWDTAKTQRKHYSRWNNAAQCTENGGLWQNFYNYLEKAPSKQMSCGH